MKSLIRENLSRIAVETNLDIVFFVQPYLYLYLVFIISYAPIPHYFNVEYVTQNLLVG